MGLFSFLKNAGAKVFKKKEKAEEVVADNTAEMEAELNAQKAATLKSLIETMNLGIEDVEVTVNGERVFLSGKAPSHSAREKAILTVGNVEGISEVDDNIYVEVPEPESQFYTVEKGDSLSKIAKSFYGNAMKYPVIFEANKPMLKDPDLIYPGQVLRIPPLEA